MKKKNKWLERLILSVLSLVMCIAILPIQNISAAEVQPKGYVIVSVEKFTLDEGWIVEPRVVPYFENKETAGYAVARALGDNNFNRGSASADTNIGYLASVRDQESPTTKVPQDIAEKLGENLKKRQSPEWLGEFDYFTGAGWMYSVNNVHPGDGMSNCKVKNNDVIRVHFTMIGGEDNNTDKTELTRQVAQINSANNKDELLKHSKLEEAYDDAKIALQERNTTQERVDQALAQLKEAQENPDGSDPEPEGYHLIYDPNGAVGSVVDDTLYKTGDTAQLKSSRPLNYPEDKFFSHWNTKSDGSGDMYLESANLRFEDKDITLYAIWDDLYTVTYDKNLESGGDNITMPVDTNSYFPGRKVTVRSLYQSPAGKVFKEWNTNADGTGEAYTANSQMTMGHENITLYAIWADGYTITYDANGGDGNPPSDGRKFIEGQKMNVGSGSLTKGNQKCSKWNTKPDGTGTTYKPNETLVFGAENIILYAVYEDAYRLSYDLNGGTGKLPSNSSLSLEGATWTVRNGTSMRKGDDVFKEWNTKPDGTGTTYHNKDFLVFGKEDVTLYAIYTQGYRVFYELNGGSGDIVDDNVYCDGNEVKVSSKTPTAPERMKFKEWNSNQWGTGTSYKGSFIFSGEKDVHLYAIYGEGHRLTYDFNGGTGEVYIDNNLYLPGEFASLQWRGEGVPTPPEGKVFAGWTLDKDQPKATVSIQAFPEQDTTVYAVYKDGLKVNYDLNGGKGTTPTVEGLKGGYNDTTFRVNNGSGITAPDGLHLKEWNTMPDGSGTTISLGSSLDVNPFIEDGKTELTLYAVYKPKYTITYDTNDGSEVNDNATYYEGDSMYVTRTVPVKEGVEFRRWNTEKDGSGMDYTAGEVITCGAGNITLYARWSANQVIYDANGGTNAPTDETLYGINTEVVAQKYEDMSAPEGKLFKEWNTKADGSGTSVASGEAFRIAKGNITLYAIWMDQEQQELIKAKEEGKAELDNYKNIDDYRDEQKAELKEAIEAGKKAIDEANDKIAVKQAVKNAKSVIDAIKTDTQLKDEEAAKIVIEQIMLLPAVNELTLENKVAVTEARVAYDNLTDTQKALVSNVSVLKAAEAQINFLEAQEIEDIEAAKNVSDQIASLPSVETLTLDHQKEVASARVAYERLTEKQQTHVTNLNTLEMAEARIKELIEEAKDDQAAIEPVIAMIDSLGEITLDKAESVYAARIAYDKLTEKQQKLVTNYDVLEAAEKAINQLEKNGAQTVSDMIDALPALDKLTLSDKYAVAEARAAFNELTENQKLLVENEKALNDAEAKIIELQEAADKAENDQKIAEAVINQIKSLPAVKDLTLEDKAIVEAVRVAYNSLSAVQRSYVSKDSLKVLEAVEAQILKLEEATSQPNPSLTTEPTPGGVSGNGGNAGSGHGAGSNTNTGITAGKSGAVWGSLALIAVAAGITGIRVSRRRKTK